MAAAGACVRWARCRRNVRSGRALAAIAGALGLAALGGGEACAQSTLPPPRPTPTDQGHGFEAGAALGGAAFTDSTSGAFASHGSDTRAAFLPGPALDVTWGVRVTRWLSVGAHVAYSYHTADRLPERATAAYAYTLEAGAYARFYGGALLGLRRIEPSVTIGLDPAAGSWQHYEVNQLPVQLEVAAVAVPLTLAFEIYLTRLFAVGVALQGSFWFPLSRCLTQQDTGVFACPQEHGVPNTYLFGGLTARFAFSP